MIVENSRFFRPVDMDSLTKLLADESLGHTMFMAGGTDLIPALKRQGQSPQSVIALSQIAELKGIRLAAQEKALHLGPLTRLVDVAKDLLIKEHFPALAETAALVASPQIRNQATIGGNIMVDNRCKYYNQSDVDRVSHGACFKAGGGICHLIPKATPKSVPVCRARFVSDLAPVLILANTQLVIQGRSGERLLPMKDLYEQEGLYGARLNPGEVLVGIEIPLPLPGMIRYDKLRIRQAIDFPSLGVAMLKEKRGDKEILQACLTGVDTHPVHLEFVRQDYGSDEEFWQTVAQVAMKSVTPLKQDFFPPQYKRQMIPVLLKRLYKD
ncbi:MAG: FAD binding domain-containing protein [Bdellovibrionaceae bacterium]|nr:FAD binding domain-containing protein [Bdellovibrionales bacterium]MCB9083806.1 FAD binding domain-containing protein [Pseudobdellovibrionaceae bacterium]